MGFGKVIGITVVGVGIIAAVGLMVVKSPIGKQFTEGRNQQDDSLAVIMEPVTFGDLERTVSAPGSIEPRKLINISSQVSAKVLALPFEEGEFVNEGDVVIRLDPQNLIAILDSSKAGLKQQQASLLGAEASLINARVQYERLQSLQETGDATQAELDSAEAAYLNAQSSKAVIEASIEQAEARIEQAEKDLENTVISSPIDGVITSLNTEVGETVIVGTTNNPGSIIMEIADLSEMLLKAAVDEANISPVEVGQEAKIFINAYTDREYQGNIQRIGLKRQVASDGTGTFEVEILMNLSEGETLYSGLSASTDIIVEHFYDAMIVPSQAVVDRRIEELPEDVREGNDLIDLNKTFTRIVYVVKDGKTVATPVTVGPSDLTQTVITEGLSKDDIIVTGPFRLLVDLKHDRAVRDQNADTESESTDTTDESADDDQTESDQNEEAEAVQSEDDQSSDDDQESP
ncbi:MAG: efflux RND transporter periplasmic adaptor subunit [Phycisphaerales bacterium]|nr:efflux RND transporter periplasmic adaptor subunit [Phycisphaerales bacterium]